MKTCTESIFIFKALFLSAALAFGGWVFPVDSSGSVVFEFVDGTALDQADIGAAMTVSNLTITTVDIVGQDGSRNSDGAEHKTNIYSTWNALGINDANVLGNEYGSFDSGEAWVFAFDADVSLSEIDFAGQGDGAELTISSSAFPDMVLGYVDAAAIHDLGNTFVPAGTEITFNMTSPTNAADTSLRIVSLTVTTASGGVTANGTPYAWLDSYYTGLVSEADYLNADMADSDGDTLPAWKEYICGTSPTNAASVMEISAVEIGGSNCIVSWRSVTGKSYRVTSTASLVSSAWATEARDLAGLDSQTSYTSTVGTANASFYKVGIFEGSQNIELPRFISSNMVIQRDMPIHVWGWAPPNETIEVILEREGNFSAAEAISDNEGVWEITLPQQAVCTTPCTLTFELAGMEDSRITLTNILIGDVWLASGQSNMEKKVGHLIEASEITALSDQYDQIRSFRARYNLQYEPSERVAASSNPWYVINSSNVASDVSAVAYCFALKIHTQLNVPIGILQSYRGGTEIETWMSDDIIQTHPDLSSVREREQDWDPADPKAYSYQYSVHYNGQIHPLIGLPIKGVIWYQGESNTKRAYEYALLQKALIQDWREKWGPGDVPFLFVQLFNMGPTENSLYVENNWCDLRDQQVSLLSDGITNIAMAVSIDTNEDPDNPDASIRIHPKNKKPIGDRLAWLALKNVYNHTITAESPLVDSYSVQGSGIVVEFKHVGDGLKMKDGDSELKGFVIAGENRVFHEAMAEIVNSNELVITSGSVPLPVTVRYAWAKNPDCNLYNSADLPASPFRLDSWPSQYLYDDLP